MKKSVEVNDILEKGKRIFGFQCDETKKIYYMFRKQAARKSMIFKNIITIN